MRYHYVDISTIIINTIITAITSRADDSARSTPGRRQVTESSPSSAGRGQPPTTGRAPLGERRARDHQADPAVELRRLFTRFLPEGAAVDARFTDATRTAVIGVGPLPFEAPVVAALLADALAGTSLRARLGGGASLLVRPTGTGKAEEAGEVEILRAPPESGVTRVDAISEPALATIGRIVARVPDWPGRLDEHGRHTVSLTSPPPGPHFHVNVLLGNRVGFAHTLQTTPKSVVDRLGRGSFRSHAATQVLATRWDMRSEENGFPANRQFYLTEDGRQVFYSALPEDANVEWAETTHAPNRTVIAYRTRCNLEIRRTIFLLPYEPGLPLAVEVQAVEVRNLGGQPRRLRYVGTGMFGAASPGGLMEDVVYTVVSMEGRVLTNPDGTIAAATPHYHAPWAREDARFHTLVAHAGGRTIYPNEFSTSYNDFVGSSSLDRPAGLGLLPNALARKGPGFFALGVSFDLPPNGRSRIDGFTGLVSSKDGESPGEAALRPQVQLLLERYASAEAVDAALARVVEFADRFAGHIRLSSGDRQLDAYVNQNLPFQVLYQTFVSRSFCQTQKGYREIGFREIQDLFAAMPHFVAMGHQPLVKDLLREWAGQVHDLGFANHNFYWAGKEPGEWSDDALWLVQALDQYANLTGDFAFLEEHASVAGSRATRSLHDTVAAIVRYSGEISVGRHGLPLLDRADWNDTLRLDPTYLNGPEKARLVAERVARGEPPGPLDGDGSESAMNAFLLKVALDGAARLATGLGRAADAASYGARARSLADAAQHHAWKGDFFARVLFNRADLPFAFLGSTGDGLSADPALPGSYFLNSFTWPILAGVATEEQIRTMLGVIRRFLWTPFGLKLCSPIRYADITERGGSAEYFPGDRENGGVFKHADMMAVVAMIRAANAVADAGLARELRDLAWAVIDLVLPYRCLEAPYRLGGNPRFCTQYNNSETGENIGPILSGTSTWLALALREAFGVSIRPESIDLAPLLAEPTADVTLDLDFGNTTFRIRVEKPRGFSRVREGRYRLTLDGRAIEGHTLPRVADHRRHEVRLSFEA